MRPAGGARLDARVLVAALCIVGAGASAAAQDLRGTVLDSASRLPVPGAVMLLLDSAGQPVGRNITDERGQYRIALPRGTIRVRFLRIGFRAREVALAVHADGVQQLDVALAAIPTLLEPVRVAGTSPCPRRADRAAALALMDQARAALLAIVVARESNPAELKLIGFERTMDGTGNDILRQKVRVDSGGRRTASFFAARDAANFVRQGFMVDSAGTRTFFGPDAEILLDDGFANGYCFHFQDPGRGRDHQLGVGFVPADRRQGRVDIEGTLWVDTVARAMREIEFRFVGVELRGTPESGGRISFREMPNRVVLIDRWFFRLVGIQQDTLYDSRGRPSVRAWFEAHESGGEVAHAVWPDGAAWDASLGTLRLHVVAPAGEPVRSLTVRLADTDYLASPDSQGNLEIADLLPGPYSVVVIDSALARLGVALGTPVRFVAQRGHTLLRTLVAPGASEFLRQSCDARGATSRWMTVHVVGPDRAPVANARWDIGTDFGTAWEHVIARGTSGADGSFGHCDTHARDGPVDIRVWRESRPEHVVLRRVTGQVAQFSITLPPQ